MMGSQELWVEIECGERLEQLLRLMLDDGALHDVRESARGGHVGRVRMWVANACRRNMREPSCS
jgi:hypothetical protein